MKQHPILTRAAAREEVNAWLRDGGGELTPQDGELSKEEIAALFLERVSRAGFRLEVFPVSDGSRPDFDSHWTFADCALVGFKQPPKAHTEEDARLLACAALLRNEWCRQRLTKR
jgi:hypothetical protein